MLRAIARTALRRASRLPAATYHFGAIWDGAKVWKDACVTIEGERITSVGPCSGPAIDLTRYTAIPGMIDVHTHMTYVLDNRVGQAGAGGGDGVPGAGECAQDAGDRRDHGARSGRRRLRRHRHARPDCARPDGGPAHVRGGIRAADDARPHAFAEYRRWRGRSAARGAPAGGGRSGRDQDVRLHRVGPRRHGIPDVHLRRDEGGGGRGARARQAHRDPHLRSRWRARRGARRGRQRGARHRHGRRHHRRDGAAQDVLRADDRPQPLLRGQLSQAQLSARRRWTT